MSSMPGAAWPHAAPAVPPRPPRAAQCLWALSVLAKSNVGARRVAFTSIIAQVQREPRWYISAKEASWHSQPL